MNSKRHLEQTGLDKSIVSIETVNKRTELQIAAKIRQHFLTRSKIKLAAINLIQIGLTMCSSELANTSQS